MKILCEEEILKLVNEKNLEGLIEYYTPYIKAKCRRHNVHGFDFEDLENEAIRTLLNCVDKFKSGKVVFSNYYFRALSNEFNYLLRKSYIDEDLGKMLYSKDERVDDGSDALEKLEKETVKEEIKRFINGLSETEKTVIRDIYFKEKTMAEVARNLEFPFHKVQYIRNMALKKMRSGLALS